MCSHHEETQSQDQSERVCSRVGEGTKGLLECQVSTPSEWQKSFNQEFTQFFYFKRIHLQNLSLLANRMTLQGPDFPSKDAQV